MRTAFINSMAMRDSNVIPASNTTPADDKSDDDGDDESTDSESSDDQ